MFTDNYKSVDTFDLCTLSPLIEALPKLWGLLLPNNVNVDEDFCESTF